jgi:hypothetical protein
VTYGFWLQVVGAHFGQVRDGVKPIFHGVQERNPAPEHRIRPASLTHGPMIFCGHKLKRLRHPWRRSLQADDSDYQNLI